MDLDHLNGNLAWVDQTVAGTKGDVGALVLSHHLFNTVLLDQGGTSHNHPMFGAMVVHLQGEGSPWFHLDLLDLPAVSLDDAEVEPIPISILPAELAR